MAKLVFERNRYGRELLIDAATIEDMIDLDSYLELTFYTLIFLKAGEGHIRIDTESIPLSPQTVLFFRPGQRCYTPEAIFQEGVLLFFEGEFLDIFFNDQAFIYKLSFFHNAGQPSFVSLSNQAFDKVYHAALEIHQELRSLQVDSEHLLRSLLYYTLVQLNRSYTETSLAADGLLINPYLLRFKALLEQRIRLEHKVQSYADALNISRSYLNQLCTKYLGRTSQVAIRERLLLEAKKDLIFTEKDVSEIAYDLNFPAPSHFIRYFKQMTQQTPQQYRTEFSNW